MPAPDGPTIAVVSPALAVNETPFKIFFSLIDKCKFSKVISFEKSVFLIVLFSGETICALRSKILRIRSRFVKTACEAPPIVPKRRTGSNKRAIAVKKLINSPTVFVPSMI